MHLILGRTSNAPAILLPFSPASPKLRHDGALDKRPSDVELAALDHGLEDPADGPLRAETLAKPVKHQRAERGREGEG